MTVGEIIQRIQFLYSKGVQSNDSRLTPRHIYNKMLSVRSKLISQEAKKKQRISQWNYQTIPCIELEIAPIHECPCLPPIGCKILKTKYPLPQPLTNLNNHLIQSVTSLDGNIVYSEIGWTEKKYKASNKYTADKPDYFIRNNYLYITHKNGPKIITVTGLFDDPLEAENYPSFCPDEDCKGENCNDCGSPLDKDFPIDNDLVDTLIEICINELVILFSKNVEDLTNNTQDNTPE
jgi:hypothetical protein